MTASRPSLSVQPLLHRVSDNSTATGGASHDSSASAHDADQAQPDWLGIRRIVQFIFGDRIGVLLVRGPVVRTREARTASIMLAVVLLMPYQATSQENALPRLQLAFSTRSLDESLHRTPSSR